MPLSLTVPAPCLVKVVPEPEMTLVNELEVLSVLIVKFAKPEILAEPLICPVVDTSDKLLLPVVKPELDEIAVCLRF